MINLWCTDQIWYNYCFNCIWVCACQCVIVTVWGCSYITATMGGLNTDHYTVSLFSCHSTFYVFGSCWGGCTFGVGQGFENGVTQSLWAAASPPQQLQISCILMNSIHSTAILFCSFDIWLGCNCPVSLKSFWGGKPLSQLIHISTHSGTNIKQLEHFTLHCVIWTSLRGNWTKAALCTWFIPRLLKSLSECNEITSTAILWLQSVSPSVMLYS